MALTPVPKPSAIAVAVVKYVLMTIWHVRFLVDCVFDGGLLDLRATMLRRLLSRATLVSRLVFCSRQGEPLRILPPALLSIWAMLTLFSAAI